MIIPPSSDSGQAPARIDQSTRLAGATLDQSKNLFRKLWGAGYRRLVPIVPPDATISERSTLAKRVGTARDPRGKAPGVRWPDGSWSGFDWINHQCDERDLDRWHAMSAGVGIKTGPQEDGTWLVGVDADTLNPDHATFIEAEVRRTFGNLPTRIGQAPKALYLLRLTGPLSYCRIEFANAETGVAERVEILSEGKQFVASGVHPKTRAPYRWTVPLPPFAELQVHNPRDLA